MEGPVEFDIHHTLDSSVFGAIKMLFFPLIVSHLEPEGPQLEDELHGEEDGENDVEDV